ncbi:hypothetical protein ACFQH6_13300 [Halobacteriaceae archaeon GCM10025711]
MQWLKLVAGLSVLAVVLWGIGAIAVFAPVVAGSTASVATVAVAAVVVAVVVVWGAKGRRWRENPYW